MIKVVNPFNKSDEECYTAAHVGCKCGGTYAKTANRTLAGTFGNCCCSCNGDSSARGNIKSQARNL